ncbi:BglG family transcription antiterminator [Hutsoniella sourekii]
MLQQRSFYLLKLLMGNKNNSLESLQIKTNLSKRQVEYDLAIINDWLSLHDFSPIRKLNDGTLAFDTNVNDVLNTLSREGMKYIFNEEERRYLIFLYTYITKEFISLRHIVDLLEVSRGTAIDDISQVEALLNKYEISYEYSRKHGYQIKGNEDKIFRVLMKIILELVMVNESDYLLQNILIKDQREYFKKIKSYLLKFSNLNNIDLATNNLNIISYIYLFYNARQQKPLINSEKFIIKSILTSNEYMISSRILEEMHMKFSENDVRILTTLIMSYSNGNIKINTHEHSYIIEMIDEITKTFKFLYGIKVNNDDEFYSGLYAHCRPALIRMHLNYPMTNPIKNDIKNKFLPLYNMIYAVLKDSKHIFLKTLSSDEIAYLTIHFASFLHYDSRSSDKLLKAAIVCPNGIGISMLLYQELKILFPEIDILEPVSIELLPQIIDSIDIIFSTSLFETDKTLFVVDPIMSELEKINLQENIYREINSIIPSSFKVTSLLKIIKKHCVINDENALKNELITLFYRNIQVSFRRSQPMLNEIINEKSIQLSLEANDWREAIRLSAKPLLDNNSIENIYIEKMIESVEENGPYIVIAPHVAMPHARPEYGSNKIGISINSLKKPVEFGHNSNDPVKFIFCLSAIDESSHLNVLSDLVTLLNDDKFLKLLDSTNNRDDVLHYIGKVNKGVK